MVHRINLEPTLFENSLTIAISELKLYMYLVSKSKLGKNLDIILTFTNDELDKLDKE